MKTILVVDDEQDLTDVLKALLEEEGYQVHTAGDGIACLKALREVKPNLVLLDVMLPYMDGYEVLETMKSQLESSSIPVILMSVSRPKVSQAEYKWKIFVPKPFDLETLLNSITAVLNEDRSAA